MNILCIASVEDRTNLDAQILKQTIQPDRVIYHVDEEPAKGIHNRRKRISENHEILRDIVKAYKPDLVWQLEGDCELPDNCLEKLLEDYWKLSIKKNFGYVSGVQIGRHGLYHIGAWHVAEDRKSFRSVDYKLEGLQKVDATGFYCLLAPRDVWLSGKCEWTDQPYGPDVVWGLSIKEDIFVDMDLSIGHKHNGGIIYKEHISTCNVEFKIENDKWSYKTS